MDSSPQTPASPLPVGVASLWRFGAVSFDERHQQLTVEGQGVAVEPKPLQLLQLLLRHAGEVLTKRELIDALWPDRVVTDGVLTTAVNKLRTALRDDEALLIRTVHGYGYKLAVPVQREVLPVELPASLKLAPGTAPPLRPHWVLREKLGRGGQGEAWLAEHQKTRERQVFKFGLDEPSLNALKREVTIYRLLSESAVLKPALVRVSDWNFAEPPYFIESEWQQGGNLHHWAAAQGGLGAVPLVLRLRLMADLAAAVAQAHDLGVLHKDLKPSNLFVHENEAGEPQLRIADWGAGALTDAARLAEAGITQLGFTRVGEPGMASGTPGYLPPEALTGQQATARGDIYALGVLLYQLWVGDLRRPLAPGWEQDVDDPLLREDIALAAHGKPEQRLGDASELARRLRFLDERRAALAQQQAAAAEIAELQQAAAAREARQREALARVEGRRTLLQLFAVSLLVGFGLMAWLYVQAEQARAQSLRDAEVAQAVTRFLTQDLLPGANPLRNGRADVTVREVLDASARELEAALSDPAVLAATRLAIGSAYAGIGLRAPAETQLKAVLAYWQQQDAPESPAAQSARTALAELYATQADLPALRAVSREILSNEALAGDNPALRYRATLALHFADCYSRLRGQPECLRKMQTLLDTARAELGQGHPDVARIALSYAGLLSQQGQAAEALMLAREAMAQWQAAVGPDDPLLLARSQDYGLILIQAGAAEEALDYYGTLRARLVGIHGESHPDVQLIDQNTAVALLKLKRPGEALPVALALHEVRLKQFGAEDSFSRAMQGVAARALIDLGRKPEAERILEPLVALDLAVDGPDSSTTRSHQKWLAESRSRP